MIDESQEIMKEFKGSDALDAGLASAQTVEHHEIYEGMGPQLAATSYLCIGLRRKASLQPVWPIRTKVLQIHSCGRETASAVSCREIAPRKWSDPVSANGRT